MAVSLVRDGDAGRAGEGAGLEGLRLLPFGRPASTRARVSTPKGHEECSTCLNVDTRAGMKLRSSDPPDPTPFNDPDAWGFCEFCAFDVAVKDGRLIHHQYDRVGHNDEVCNGSLTEPPAHRPINAIARKRVSLFKDYQRSRRRAMWSRMRTTARETRQAKLDAAALVKPKRLIDP